MANEKLFYVGIKGLIKNKDGKYLLLKSSLRNHTVDTKPYWDIPGGRVEEGNDVLTTLQREIEEETGITEIINHEFFSAVISHHQIPIDESRKAGLVLMVYIVEIPEDSVITLSDEHTDFDWVEPTIAAQRLGNKYPEEFTSRL
jgi:8-oxo-dGTP pyrophosphatase MutT (NUDIX family)